MEKVFAVHELLGADSVGSFPSSPDLGGVGLMLTTFAMQPQYLRARKNAHVQLIADHNARREGGPTQKSQKSKIKTQSPEKVGAHGGEPSPGKDKAGEGTPPRSPPTRLPSVEIADAAPPRQLLVEYESDDDEPLSPVGYPVDSSFGLTVADAR